MKELTRHIEILLLHNDCVIVPDLGGFIAHHVAASIDKTENTFIPPHRSLGFNPLLNMSDSLLAESYMNVYDLSYPEAARYIKQEVEKIKQQLENKGIYVMGELGSLRIKEDGHYEFRPNTENIPSPQLYGFGTFELPLSILSSSKNENKSIASHVMMPLQPQSSNSSQHSLATIMSHIDNTTHSEEKTISIKVSVLRNMAVTAVAAIALVLFARPIAPNEISNRESTQTEAGMIAISNVKASENSSKETDMPIAISDANVINKIQDLALEIGNIKEKKMTPTAGNYTIVLGCSLPLENAKSFLSQMHDKGIKDAILFNCHSDNMIVYGNYADNNDAITQLNKLAQQGVAGWIMEVKP